MAERLFPSRQLCESRTAMTMLGKTALLVLAVAGVLALTACSTGSGEEGSGTEGSEARELPPFTAVEVSGQADAVVRIGEARKVTVRGDDNLLEHVETKVSGDALEVSHDEDLDPELGIAVDIRIPRLDMVELSGAGDLTAQGISGERFRAEVSGAGSVEADGRVRSVEVVVSGAGDVRLERLVAQEAKVEVSGAGSVHVHATDSLTASVSGVGDVVYSGRPEDVQEDVSGVGEVRPR
jgi:putative autotransporter adhesin-like protein